MKEKQPIMVPMASFWGISDKWTAHQLLNWFFAVYSGELGERKPNAQVIRKGMVLGEWDELEDGETVVIDNSGVIFRNNLSGEEK